MSKLKNSKALGMLAAFAANFIFGFSFLFSKIALAAAHPMVVISIRFTIAFLVLNILLLFGVFKINYKNKPIKKLLLMAFMQPFLYFIFEIYGINSTSSAVSGVIISLVPVAVMFLSPLILKEKPTGKQIIFSFISLVSVSIISIISNTSGKSTALGILLLCFAVLSAAFFNILSRGEAERFSAFERTYMMFLIGTVGFNIITFIMLGQNYIPSVLTAFSNLGFIVSQIYLAIISSIAAFLLYNFATTNIDAVRAASFSNITTVVSVFAGMIFLKDPLSPVQLICCAAAVAGVWGVNKFTK